MMGLIIIIVRETDPVAYKQMVKFEYKFQGIEKVTNDSSDPNCNAKWW